MASCNFFISPVIALIVHVYCDCVLIGIGCKVGAGSDRINGLHLRCARTGAGYAIANGGGRCRVAPDRAACASTLLQLVWNQIGVTRSGRSHGAATVLAAA